MLNDVTTVPMFVTFMDGTTAIVCCGRAVLEADNVFGYMPVYGETHFGECPNHPRPMTPGRSRIVERDLAMLAAWFDSRQPVNRKVA